MTNLELESAIASWENVMERVIVEMAAVTTPEGFVVAFDHHPLVEQFNKDISMLRHRHGTGTVRIGLKVE